MEEDDSVRCRLSGICEEFPTQKQCQDPSYLSDIHKVLPGIRGKISRRDAKLACLFDPNDRAEQIRQAASWTWKGYKDCALGQDELRPISCTGQHWFNLTLTPVDGLDTLYLLNLHDLFEDAVDVINKHYHPHNSSNCNVFETTIRILGGLLSAHHLSAASHPNASRTLLQLAVDLGSRLSQGFLSPSGIPFSDVNMATGAIDSSVEMSSTAEIATLSLEFTMLARLTGKKEFEIAALKVHDVFESTIAHSGALLPQFFSWKDGSPSLGTYYMLGARTDSYYEYLLKQWIFTGKTDERLLQRFIDAMHAVRDRLLRRTDGAAVALVDDVAWDNDVAGENKSDDMQREDVDHIEDHHHSKGLLYIAEEINSKARPKMDHLVCFLPGVFALADFHNISTVRPGSNDLLDLDVATDLARTCYELYKGTPTGLAPEIVYFINKTEEDYYPGAHVADVGGGDFTINDGDAHNLLRPETVESFYLLHKVTGDPIWRERAWTIFRAFELWSRVDGTIECVPIDAASAAEAVARKATKRAVVEATTAISDGVSVEEAIERAQSVAREVVMEMHLVNDSEMHEMVIKAGLAAAEAAAAAAVEITASLRKGGSSVDDSIETGSSMDNAREEESNTSSSFPGSSHWEDIGVCHGNNGKIFHKRIIGGGYSNLQSVVSIPPARRDKMESFWLSETLKYLYLIFHEPPERCLHPSCIDGVESTTSSTLHRGISLSSYVFNTEAHPLPIVGPQDDSLLSVVHSIDRKLFYPYGGDETQLHSEVKLDETVVDDKTVVDDLMEMDSSQENNSLHTEKGSEASASMTSEEEESNRKGAQEQYNSGDEGDYDGDEGVAYGEGDAIDGDADDYHDDAFDDNDGDIDNVHYGVGEFDDIAGIEEIKGDDNEEVETSHDEL